VNASVAAQTSSSAGRARQFADECSSKAAFAEGRRVGLDRARRLTQVVADSHARPGLIGVCIALGYLLLHSAFDAVVLAVWGFPSGEQPWWQNEKWWTDLVNAALIDYLPVALAIAKQGVARDLAELRPRLRCDDAEFDTLSDTATGSGGALARALSLSGLAVGAWITFYDPSSAGGATPSPSDPGFVWSLGRLILMLWFATRFSVYDFRLTRIYHSIGRSLIEIDLLDIRSLAPFARRGQRSALTWVLFSSILSLFWLGDSAARANLPAFVSILSSQHTPLDPSQPSFVAISSHCRLLPLLSSG